VAVEIEKLSLFVGSRAVSDHDIATLVPQAQATTIFALVAALGRRERRKALELLDVLVREGEYLPLALSFLSTQFRQALVAQEAGLRGAMAVQGHFAKSGIPMWPSRAEQVSQTMGAFTPAQIKTALSGIAHADKALRDTRPDDRTVLEDFVLALTRP
jgi:DNA polymerase-3 subunit delta